MTFEQPSSDKRIYKHVTIHRHPPPPTDSKGGDQNPPPSPPKGQQEQEYLDILVISDPDTDKASAAMDVHVGQLSDGDFPGIAHFCEHMLFIGTEKYPTENAYDQFLTSHGGSSNAFTDLEHTCYYFDIQAEQLEGALDRFAQCFIGPLFTQSAVEREIQAVDSEHHKNLQQDMWRQYQLSKTMLVGTSTQHAYSSFGSGNQESLPIANIRQALLEFYDKNYRKSLSLYKLVVLGKETVEDLEVMVRKYFEDLSLAMRKEPSEEEAPVGEEASSSSLSLSRDDLLKTMFPPITEWNVPQRLHIVPVSQVHSIELQFPMPSQLSYWESKPSRYLSHLIGHEGQGSLLSLLKEKDYALELYADDSSNSCIPWSIFTVRIELTDLGLENVNEIVQILFSYIELLKTKPQPQQGGDEDDDGPPQWVQQELKTVSDLKFRFMSKQNPMDYTCSLAGWMQLYPPTHYLSGPYKISQWKPKAVEECLSCLHPDNVLWMISSPSFLGQLTNPQTEKWYGTQYEKIELDEPLQNQLRTALASDFPELTLPQVNDMIATDFELLPKDFLEKVPVEKPQCVSLTMGSTSYLPDMQLWYKPDNVFEMPKVNLLFHFSSKIANATPQDVVSMQLFVEWIQEQVNEYTYLASMAGLHCNIGVSAGARGIDLQVSGYHHKAHVLVEHLFSVIRSSLEPSDTDDTDLFRRLVYKLEQQYQEFLVAQPYQHAIYGADQVLEEGKYTIEQKLSSLPLVNKAMIVEHAKRFWKDCRMVVLSHGNISPHHAQEMTDKIWSTLCTLRGEQQTHILSLPPDNRIVQLSPGTSYLYRFRESNEANTNSCMQMILQMGGLSLKDNATLVFLHHLIREPAFNQLRTEEQLGYIVHTSIKTSGSNIKSLVILIQSDAFDPIHVEQRVEDFLTKFRPKIVDMTPEEFASNIHAVMTTLLEKVQSHRRRRALLALFSF